MRQPYLMLAVALALGGVAPASAQVFREFEYGADRVYPVSTALGITTQIELSPNENVLDYSVGFAGGWDVIRRENVFYLRPRNVDVDTNMMVRTETHTYIFDLKVVASDWTKLEQAKSAGVQYKATFKYPEDTKFNTVKAPEPPEADATIVASRDYFQGYEFSTRTRAAWLVPVAVYDDGRFTYVRMGEHRGAPTGNFPAVYGRHSAHGEDFLLNTTVQNNTIIVHGVYPYLVLRQGNEVIGLRRGVQK